MKRIGIMTIAILMVLSSCIKGKWADPRCYFDMQNEQISVGATTATIQCEYKIERDTFYYYDYVDYEYVVPFIVYWESENAKQDTFMVFAGNNGQYNKVRVALDGLKENTTYYYYYVFRNGYDSIWTENNSFKTEHEATEVTLPTVHTVCFTEVTTTSAIASGRVTESGGADVTERGFCWGFYENPTLSDNHIAVGMGIGEYSETISGLDVNTTYHFRAYATNEVGTAYGLDLAFTTHNGAGNAPVGAIDGLFTINENGDQVYFSQGNLQYQASTNTWRFAENQYDYVGGSNNGSDYGNVYENGVKCSNNNISATYNGWIDMFGWGTSGWNNGNLYYRPYDSERVFNPEMGYGYGPTDGIHCTFDLSGDYANADWGVYNAISNGGNMPNQWRTLTQPELKYVFDDRTTASNIRYAKAVVNEIAGVVLLPDGWNASIYSLNNPNVSEAPFAGNEISASDWEKMETNGAVFFPVNGQRVGTSYHLDYPGGIYWSSSAIPYAGQQPYNLSFQPNYVSAQSAGISKDVGISVRLVQDANP